jgi:Tat protein translocase TatB subunit
MFGSIGFTELMLIFAVALIVFGPRKLPEIGRSIGKALGEFRRATTELKTTLEEEVRYEEKKESLTATTSPQPPATVPTSSEPASAPTGGSATTV